MLRLGLQTLLLSALVSASPLLKAVEWTPDYSLDADDVVAAIDGKTLVLKEADYLAYLKAEGIKIGAPELDPEWITYNGTDIPDLDARDVEPHSLEARQTSCENTFSIVTDKTETFVDWDVQMSPVVCAVGAMDVTVSSGYSVANTVGGSAGIDLKFIKDRLGGSVGVDYSRTWTTSSTIMNKGTVQDGWCGVMITKPITTRRSGRQFRGCIGSTTQTGTWYADSHNEKAVNGISWVEGAISMCTKRGNNPPLSRCNGQGNFI
ncbi:hypothetical protein SLS57_011479 [Botryosphaeria dothidea]